MLKKKGEFGLKIACGLRDIFIEESFQSRRLLVKKKRKKEVSPSEKSNNSSSDFKGVL